MHTGDYLSTLVADNIHPGFLPVVLFLLASVMAFATRYKLGHVRHYAADCRSDGG